jgi:hypothetical protein
MANLLSESDYTNNKEQDEKFLNKHGWTLSLFLKSAEQYADEGDLYWIRRMRARHGL